LVSPVQAQPQSPVLTAFSAWLRGQVALADTAV
jgi:hypothetical protein